MGWFDKLKHLFKIDIRDSFNIHIKSDNISKPYDYNKETKSLSINLGRLTPAEKEEFKPILEEAIEDGKILLEQKSEKIIEDFKLTERSTDVQLLLKFFKDKIPLNDLDVLRASLYIDKLFKEGRSSDVIHKLRWDIIKKYGVRGRNICNLSSAGYFETVVKPLYEEMKNEHDFSHEKFLESYNIIIQESAFAVFVNVSMSKEDVKRAIEEKIKRNLRYGIKFVNIHGMGKDNVTKIRKVISEFEVEYPHIKKSIEEKESIIFAKLLF